VLTPAPNGYLDAAADEEQEDQGDDKEGGKEEEEEEGGGGEEGGKEEEEEEGEEEEGKENVKEAEEREEVLVCDGVEHILSSTGGGGGREREQDLRKVVGGEPRGYWHEWANVDAEVRKYIAEHGNGWSGMPAMSQLRKHGLSSLEDAITQFGGVIEVAGRLGLACGKPEGYSLPVGSYSLPVGSLPEGYSLPVGSGWLYSPP
jgi:hypothetical protein